MFWFVLRTLISKKAGSLAAQQAVINIVTGRQKSALLKNINLGGGLSRVHANLLSKIQTPFIKAHLGIDRFNQFKAKHGLNMWE